MSTDPTDRRDAAVSVRDVTKSYGDVVALDGLSLEIGAGSTFGLLGTNGAGKTTLFKLLVGHVLPDAGTVSVAGRDVTAAGPAIRRDVGYLPERAGFPGPLTGREVLRFHARVRGLPEREDRVAAVLGTVGLADAADRRVDGYSNGMRRRLGLATALLPRPGLLLLDEPTAGLDPRGVAAFHRVLGDLRDGTNLTVVLASHVLSEVERLCDEVAIVHEGRLRACGQLEALRAAGDGVTIELRLASPADADRADGIARDRGAAVERPTETRLEIACDHAAAPGLLATIAGAVDLAGYEVTEPGLDRLFERAVAGDGVITA